MNVSVDTMHEHEGFTSFMPSEQVLVHATCCQTEDSSSISVSTIKVRARFSVSWL